MPQFAHVPLILGPDKKRLSKRHGATSVTEYARQGYLPEAMVNFLALLGWSPGTNQELFTRDELIAQFALEGISGGNAVFNPREARLDERAAHRAPVAEAIARAPIRADLEAAGLWPRHFDDDVRGPWLNQVIDLLKPRVQEGRATSSRSSSRSCGSAWSTILPRSRSTSERQGSPTHIAALADAFEQLATFDVATSRSSVAARCGDPRCEGGCPHPCDPRGTDGEGGEPWSLRGGRAGGSVAHRRSGCDSSSVSCRHDPPDAHPNLLCSFAKSLTNRCFRLHGLAPTAAVRPVMSRPAPLNPHVSSTYGPSRGISVAAALRDIGLPAEHGLQRDLPGWRNTVAKEDRGFASMDRAKQREIASKGGKAAHQKGTAHEWTSEEAREAGRKGGMASHRRKQQAREGGSAGEQGRGDEA